MSKENLLSDFTKLHHGKTPLILANIWDAQSAIAAEKSGFKALGTSSHAIANMLGYEDGEMIPVDELIFIIEKIATTTKLPISVDFEGGYSDEPSEVLKNINKLLIIESVVGINIEDGKVINGKRALQDAEILSEKIKAIKKNHKVFINARIDTFTTQHKNPLQEAIIRAELYKKSGADGIFLPLIEKKNDLEEFVKNIKLPLNIFASTNMLHYEDLTSIGVKRISHGAKQYEKLLALCQDNFKELYKSKNFKIVL